MARATERCLLSVLLLAAVILPTTTHASSGGISSEAFPVPASGCNFCHGGGSVPTVELIGPTAVAPSSTNEYTFRVFEVGSQDHAGLNIEAALGVLATGGVFATGTQSIANGTSGLDEITHTGPKIAAAGMVEFSFLWTAPASFTSATINAWGNAVNFNSNTSGDMASMTSLVVTNNAVPTSTPTSTPTATPTATPTTAQAPDCPATTDGACMTGFGKGLLLIKDDGAKSKLVAKFLKGPALTQTQFGDPLVPGGTIYDLCVYDDAGDLVHAIDGYQVDRAGETTCDSKDCWKAISKDPPDGKGYKFKEKDGNSNGVIKILLKGGDAGKSKALVKGKGANLASGVPALLTSTTSATIQLRASDGVCISVDVTDIKKSDPDFFKAK